MSNEISAETSRSAWVQGKVFLLDVRTPGEFAALHAEGAVNLPLDDCTPEKVQALVANQQAEAVHVLCQAGGRARMAADRLAGNLADLTLAVVQGGTDAWNQAHLPVIKGKGVMSLERQVRIAAGFLVLTGTVLGYFVHRGFFGVPAFVGAGLMFAGITNTCGMGMMLAKMPWNRRDPSQGPTCSVPNRA